MGAFRFMGVVEIAASSTIVRLLAVAINNWILVLRIGGNRSTKVEMS